MKKILYLKSDWIKDINGQRFTSNQQILDYQLGILEKVNQYGFAAIKVRPRGMNWHRDQEVVIAYLDECQRIGMQVYFDNHSTKEWGEWQVVKNVIQHSAVVGVTINDEPQSIEEIIDTKSQYDYMLEYTNKPLITAFIGEHLTATATPDPYDDDLDYHAGYVRQYIEYCDCDSAWVRHYPIRRNRGTVHCAYTDKMVLSYPDFIEALSDIPGTVPILQGFGSGVARTPKEYWSLPTKTELADMIKIASQHFQTVAFYRACNIKDKEGGQCSLLDNMGIPMKAHDGSYPIDALDQF